MWKKLDKSRYEHQGNGAFIANFRFLDDSSYYVYVNFKTYASLCADFKSFEKLKDAKKFGDSIETSGLVAA